MIYKKILITLSIVLLWVAPVVVAAKTTKTYPNLPSLENVIPLSEKIQSFHSDITVHEDGTLLVTETINVIANGITIRHGIYRDFPTVYPHPSIPFLRTTTGFTVRSVTKNGIPETYTIRTALNGKRVYIGDESVVIEPGKYTYTITYTTSHQLYFAEHNDELFWNVTGNGWSFPISEASATVYLPANVAGSDALVLDGFTGTQGSTDKNFTASINKNGNPVFITTTPLLQHEGLSIIVQFPTGHVTKEHFSLLTLCKDNPELPAAAALIVYYLFVWFMLGRDPKKSTRIPLYEPPQNLSPAAMRYIMRMSVNSTENHAVAAAIIHMGVNGWIKLSKDGKTYTVHKIEKAKKQVPLSVEEEALYTALFNDRKSVALKKDNHVHISAAIHAFGRALHNTYKKNYFRTHTGYWVLGALLSCTILILPLVLFHSLTAGSGILFVVSMLFNIIFFILLKSPTRAGQQLRSEIDGFKWFLSVTEKERLAFAHPPKQTPELFEQFLPYALALGVENKWAQQFAGVFAEMQKAGQPSSGLGWYRGMYLWSFAQGHELSSFGSAFSATISSAAAAPSSRGGGGGFSGGGGGGGGGGGW